jgi:hypothetical protein
MLSAGGQGVINTLDAASTAWPALEPLLVLGTLSTAEQGILACAQEPRQKREKEDERESDLKSLVIFPIFSSLLCCSCVHKAGANVPSVHASGVQLAAA